MDCGVVAILALGSTWAVINFLKLGTAARTGLVFVFAGEPVSTGGTPCIIL